VFAIKLFDELVVRLRALRATPLTAGIEFLLSPLQRRVEEAGRER
jgi:hypothetical protein